MKNSSFDGKSIWISTIKLSLPMLLSNVLTTFYTIIDTYFISLIDKKSTAYISAVSIINPVFFIFIALSSGLFIGISSLIARSYGEGDEKKEASGLISGLTISIIISIITLLFGYIFLKDLVRLFAGKELSAVAIKSAEEFLFYLLPGYCLMLIGRSLFGVLQGKGQNFHIAIAVLISNILNCILDPVFIFYFKMGVGGAGLATSLSILFTAIYVLTLFAFNKFKISFGIKYLNFHTIKEILQIGITQSIGILSLSVSFIIVNKIVGSIGETEMNAFGLCGRLDQLTFLPIFAIASSTVTITGYYFGKKNYNIIKEIFIKNSILGILSMLALILIYIIFSPQLFALFSDNQTVINKAVYQARIVSLSFLGIALESIAVSTFQGMKYPPPSFLLIIIRMFIVILPLSYFFVFFLKLGMNGIFISYIIAHINTGIISCIWIYYYLKKYNLWRETVKVENPALIRF